MNLITRLSDDKYWLKFSLNSLLIFSAVVGLIFSSWQAIWAYGIYEDKASWYFPVGIELAALFLLPFRYWAASIVASLFGSYFYAYIYFDSAFFETIYLDLVNDIANRVFPAMGVALVKIKFREIRLDKLDVAIAVIFAALAYRLTRFFWFYYINHDVWLYENVPTESHFELFMLHVATGFVAIFIVFVFVFTAKEFKCYWATFSNRDRLLLIFQLFLVCCFTTALYRYEESARYALQMCAFIPIIWFAYRFGWLGVMLLGNLINLMILCYLYEAPDELIMELQPFVISYSLVAILVGAVVSENNQIRETLCSKNKELSIKNDELRLVNDNNKKLLARVQQVQEEERKLLSQSLHDELGQNITAFKLAIQAHNKEHKLNNKNALLLQQSANEIYKSVYDLMHWLRPRILDDIGITQIIVGDFFAIRLERAGIHYRASINRDIDRLPDRIIIGVFRIIQEAVTNTIKHSGATIFTINIVLDSEELSVVIKDNGKGYNFNSSTNSRSGFGLDGIQERVDSLCGVVSFTHNDGFSIDISIPVSNNEL